MEVEKQIKNRNVYQEVNFSENILNDVEKSNTMFKNLRRKGVKYFSFEYKKVTNLGKVYLLPKIHKRLKDVSGRLVISKSWTPSKKVPEFVDHLFKPGTQNGWPYIKDSGDFLKKIGNVDNIPENVISVTTHVVGLHPNIPHNAGNLKLLMKCFKERNTRLSLLNVSLKRLVLY